MLSLLPHQSLRARLWNLYDDIEDGIIPLEAPVEHYEAIRQEDSPAERPPKIHSKQDGENIDQTRLSDFVSSCGLRSYHLPDPRRPYLESHLWETESTVVGLTAMPGLIEYRILSIQLRATFKVLAEEI